MFRPSFEKGSILKQGMLEALRDYPYKAVELLYSNYGDGVIIGFEISIQDDSELVISPGIIKINGKVYLSTEDIHIKQKEETQYVNVMLSKIDTPDGKEYIIELMQSDTEIQDNIELFRYTKNAKLYKFQSVQEVINLPMNRIDITKQKQSINGGSTLAQDCFVLYAKEILNSDNASMKDIAFAYQCLNGINNIGLIEQYFDGANTNEEIIKGMRSRLALLSKSKTIITEEPVKKEKPKTMYVH